ncbi:MAG TPA: TolC family protein [Phycisphaerae bacterium]|nr:TolC family protein [Phycisphaerae bacterium]
MAAGAGVFHVAMLSLAGCQATLPNVPADAAKLTGIQNAITFHQNTFDPADRSGITGQLTLADAIRQTLANDPRIQSALAHVRMAEADANQARLLPNPILSVDIRMPAQPGVNTTVEATLTDDLISLLQKPSQIAAADKRLRESAGDALTTVLDVLAEVQVAYATAGAIDAQIAWTNQRNDILQHVRTIAQKRLNAGDTTRLDLVTVDAQLVQARLDLADLQLQRTEQYLLLAKLTGHPRAALDWTVAPLPNPPPEAIADENAWIDAALIHRPEIASHVWELRALGDDLTTTSLAPFIGGDLGPHAEHDPLWRVGPSFTTPLPIFDWGQAGRAKVIAQRIAARHDLALEQMNIIQEVRLAYATYQQTLATLREAQAQLLPLQKQQLDQAQLAYQTGDTDLTTLLLAQTDFQTAAARLVDFQQRALIARVKLQRAAGGAAIAAQLHPPTTAPASAPSPETEPAPVTTTLPAPIGISP